MFNSSKVEVKESESAALSVCNIDDDDDGNDVGIVASENKSKRMIESLSSNIKEKLEKKTFHRLDINDEASDSGSDDIQESQISQLESICCHLLSMIFVSLTQITVSSALYIIVPLHIKYKLLGGEILTGLIFLNYGFAYLVFHIFGVIWCNYYGSTFTILIGILLSSLSLLFMTIFTDYFVWLMMMFIQGISFALFNIGSHNFIIDNISIKSRSKFSVIMTAFHKVSMICGCILAGNASIAVTLIVSLSGIIFLCTFSIPPRYNGNYLVGNESITKASITAWRASFQQLSFKQRVSIFAWIKNEKRKEEETPIYALDDELNTFAVFTNNISTIISLSIFSFGLIYVRCSRLLIVTFKCMEIETLTAHDIGYINGISFLPELFLYNIGEYLLYRFGRKYTLITSYFMFIVALFSLPYAHNIASLSFVSLIFGVGNGISHGLIHKVAIDVAPTEYRDKFLCIYTSFTDLAFIVAPISVSLLVQGSSMETACVCSALVVILSLLWSLCIMTDPNKTGKRYEQLDCEKNNDENNGMLINGKHIGPPIPNIDRFKMELHSIDSVMERDESVNNDNDNNNNNKSESDDDNIKNIDDDYASRIANKDIGDIKLGADLHRYTMPNQYKFEIGHFDEEEEESMSYQLSSTDDD